MGLNSSKNQLYNLILESQISLYDETKDITRIEPKKMDDEDIEYVNNVNIIEMKMSFYKMIH